MEIPEDGNDSESSESFTEFNRFKHQSFSTDPQAPFNHLVGSAAKIFERTMLDDKYDYYLDLDDDPVEAKLVGLTIDLIIKAVSKKMDRAASKNSFYQPEVMHKVLDAVKASVSPNNFITVNEFGLTIRSTISNLSR